MIIIISLVTFILGGGLVWFVMRVLLKSRYEAVIREAEKESEVMKQKKLLEVKEKFLHLKSDLEKQVSARNSKIQSVEAKLKQRELTLNQRQEDLQRKLQYIESADTMLSDLSVTDFIVKEELQQLQGAFAALTNSYNAIIDLDGDPITYPEGPETNMGAFYDMFERVEYKRGYFELNKKLRKEHGPAMITLKGVVQSKRNENADHIASLPQNADLATLIKAASKSEEGITDGVLVGIPLYINDKQLATWINCAFTQEEVARIDSYLASLWSICNYMAQFIYSNTISQQEAQKARFSEVQARELLERSSVISDILRRCNEDNAENTLSFVLRKVGTYLKLSRISLFRYEENTKFPSFV